VGWGWAGGRGDAWLPSVDRHTLRDTHGKLGATLMVYVGAEEKLCFRMIGSKRFCRSEVCSIMSHKTSKFSMGVKGGWFLAGKSTQAGRPNAFTFPFLDGSKITENMLSILNNPLD
jgi:hypothetical protein